MLKINFLDWAMIALLLLSGIIGIFRGFIKEILKFLNLATAGLAVALLIDRLVPIFNFIASPYLQRCLAGGIIFLGFLILGNIIVYIISSNLKPEGLIKFIDQLMGLSYGGLRGLLILITFITLLEQNNNITETSLWKNSKITNILQKNSVILMKIFPDHWKTQIDQLFVAKPKEPVKK